MRFALIWCVTLLVVSGCGGRSEATDWNAGGELDAGLADSSPTSDSDTDARDGSPVPDAGVDRAPDVADAAIDIAPDTPSRICPLVQTSGFVRLGLGPEGWSDAPAPRWTGDGWAVTWRQDKEPNGPRSTYFAFVREGQVEVEPREIIAANDPGPGPAWNGSELVLCWDTGSATMVARLDRAGDRVVPDTAMFPNTGYGCGVRRTGDRLLATLSASENETYHAWLSLEGGVIGGPSLVVGPTEHYYTSASAILDDGLMVVWGDEPDSNTVLTLRRLDNHFKPVVPDRQLADQLSRPMRPALHRVGNSVAFAACSDEDEAPADGLSVWMQPLGLDGQPSGSLKHVADTEDWVRPVMLDVGDQLLLGTIWSAGGPLAPPEPVISRYAASGELLGNVHWSHPLPDVVQSHLALAPGRSWEEVGVAFAAYGEQPRPEVYFTTLSCGE